MENYMSFLMMPILIGFSLVVALKFIDVEVYMIFGISKSKGLTNFDSSFNLNMDSFCSSCENI